MAELSTKARDTLRSSQFAYVDREGGEHLPIHDASHVRNALARFNQTDFESKAAKDRAWRKILRAADRFGIEVDQDDAVSLVAGLAWRGIRGFPRTDEQSDKS